MGFSSAHGETLFARLDGFCRQVSREALDLIGGGLIGNAPER